MPRRRSASASAAEAEMTVGEASSSSATADGDGNTRGSGGTYHQGNWTKRGRKGRQICNHKHDARCAHSAGEIMRGRLPEITVKPK